MRAQTKATIEMVVTNAEKTAVIRDQAALQLFSIPNDSMMSNMAQNICSCITNKNSPRSNDEFN